jgi:hypothetical protein
MLHLNILWRVRVAPLITVDSGSLISLLDNTKVETTLLTIQFWTLKSGHSETQLNCSGLTTRWLFSVSLLPHDSWLFTQSPEVGSQRTWERSLPFKVLSIFLQSGCVRNSRFLAITAEMPTHVGFCGRALSKALPYLRLSVFRLSGSTSHCSLLKAVRPE